jgi:2-iminobutanoate/2-iminopropanoate deaminase
MPVNSYNPDNVWQPFGAFSMAVVQGEGKVVHLKGQVSLDQLGEVVGADDMETQVTQVLDNISTVLANFGGHMEDIYTLIHYVTNIEAFMGAGHIRSQYFKAPYPVTTTIEVSRLYHPQLLVEITASAEIPLERFTVPDKP